VCGFCTRTDIVREHLEDNLRICDVSAKGLYIHVYNVKFVKKLTYLVVYYINLLRGHVHVYAGNVSFRQILF
jgi:hypothetical protein